MECDGYSLRNTSPGRSGLLQVTAAARHRLEIVSSYTQRSLEQDGICTDVQVAGST